MAITGSVAAIRAGGAAIELGLKDNVTMGLNRIGRRLGNFSKSGAKAIGTLTKAFVTLGIAIIGVGYKLVRMSSNMEETMNKFDVMFGDSADSVREWGYAFGNQVGRSRKQMVDMLSSFKALTTSMGMTDEAGTQLSKSFTELAIDLGSFYNMADQEALERLHSALVGNHETMRKFGVAITEATIKQEAMNQGLDPTNISDVNKVIIRYTLILRALEKQQGDATRTAGTFANQWKALWAQMSDFAIFLGDFLLGPATDWLQWLNDSLKFLRDFVKVNDIGAREVWDLWNMVVAKGMWTAADSVMGAFQAMMEGIPNLIVAGGHGVINAWVSMTQFIQDTITGMYRNILEGFRVFLNWWDEGMGDVVDIAHSALDGIEQFGNDARGAIANWSKGVVDDTAKAAQAAADYTRRWKTFTEEQRKHADRVWESTAGNMINNVIEARKQQGRLESEMKDLGTEAEKAAEKVSKAHAATAPSTIFRGAAGSAVSMYNIQEKAEATQRQQLLEMRAMRRALDSIDDGVSGLGAV